MQRMLEFMWPSQDEQASKLHPDFVSRASRFYVSPNALWEPLALNKDGKPGKVWYLLKRDANRDLVVQRLLYIDAILQRVWTRLRADKSNYVLRQSEMTKLGRCLDPGDGISRVAQKPLGGYDVRAYAHDSWVFVEIPTFTSVETGADGINLTEDRRRKTLVHIILHELAHVAGYWEHDDKHAKCIAWLTKYLDPGY